MTSPINAKIILHPMNWVTIMLMVIIAGTFGHLFLSYLGIEPSTAKSVGPSTGLTPGQSVVLAVQPQGAATDAQ